MKSTGVENGTATDAIERRKTDTFVDAATFELLYAVIAFVASATVKPTPDRSHPTFAVETGFILPM